MARLSNICVKWNNQHNALVSLLYSQLQDKKMLDVTIAAEGKFIHVHRLLLCASSTYFEELLSQFDRPAVVILQNVKFSHLKLLVEYIYKGEVSVSVGQLDSFLEAAKCLQIKGLIKEESSSDQVQEPTVETPVNPEPSTPDSIRPNQDEESANDLDVTAFLEIQENFDQQQGDTDALKCDKVVHPKPIIINQDDGSVEEEQAAADPEIEMETNDKENPDGNSIPNSLVDEDLLKSDSEEEEMDDEQSISATGPPNNKETDENGDDDLKPNQSTYQPFKCDACGRDFHNKNFLKRHSQKGKCHSVSYFRCGLCGLSSNQRWSLKRHLKRLHKNVESSKFNDYVIEIEPTFTCSLCSYRGEDLASLHKHKKKKHGLKIQFKQSSGGV